MPWKCKKKKKEKLKMNPRENKQKWKIKPHAYEWKIFSSFIHALIFMRVAVNLEPV